MMTIPGRIPIAIHPLFWLIAFFIGWMWTMTLTGALLALPIILFSVVLHELGHALTAMTFGQKTRIELAAFGGFTYREGRKLKLWEEFLVVLCGPLVGIVIALATWLILLNFAIENTTLAFIVNFALIANLFWTLINLVPVLPLDGGHLLSIILEALFGFKGIKMAIMVGITIAIALSVTFFVLRFFILGALFLILTFESFRSLRYYRLFKEKDRDTDIQDLLKSAEEDYQAGSVDLALQKLGEVRSQTKEGLLFSMATEEMAEIYRNQRRYKEAYSLLAPMQKNLSGDSLALFQFLAYMNGDFQKIFDFSNKCFQENPSSETALINALACGSLAKAEAAVGWLECALREGLTSVEQAIGKVEFDPVRHDARFKAFLGRQKILP